MAYIFNRNKVVENAKAGLYTKKELSYFIQVATRLGFREVVAALKLCRVNAAEFAVDPAPQDVKIRLIQGARILSNQHIHPENATMFNRLGPIESINRICQYASRHKKFSLLAQCDHINLTVEAIVLDYSQFFPAKTVALARQRMYLH